MIYDFLVFGGGIAGVSAAYELTVHGKVELLEAEGSMGYHATGRSAVLFTRNYGGPIVRQVNAASAGFFRAPPEGFCDTPLSTPRCSLTVVPPYHEGTLDALLAMSEPGEEICPIDPKDACEMVPFLHPDRVARALAALIADLCTAASTAHTDRFAKALSPHRLL
jgi:D-arginine dehydrogenase